MFEKRRSRNRLLTLLTAVLGLALGPVLAAADEPAWLRALAEANRLRDQGKYAGAEKRYAIALEEARHFGEDDRRVASTSSHLAALYRYQGRYEPAFSI